MQIRATHYGDQFALLHACDGDVALIAGLEIYAFDGRTSGAAMRLLIEGAAKAGAPSDPARLADALDELLRANPAFPTQVSFAGATIGADGTVQLSAAGSLRVQLVRHGTIVASAGGGRDTWLGRTPHPTPEVARWSAADRDDVVICSEEIHRGRAADAYASELIRCVRDLTVPADCASGLVASIVVRRAG